LMVTLFDERDLLVRDGWVFVGSVVDPPHEKGKPEHTEQPKHVEHHLPAVDMHPTDGDVCSHEESRERKTQYLSLQLPCARNKVRSEVK
jgi:hypothetical protein